MFKFRTTCKLQSKAKQRTYLHHTYASCRPQNHPVWHSAAHQLRHWSAVAATPRQRSAGPSRQDCRCQWLECCWRQPARTVSMPGWQHVPRSQSGRSSQRDWTNSSRRLSRHDGQSHSLVEKGFHDLSNWRHRKADTLRESATHYQHLTTDDYRWSLMLEYSTTIADDCRDWSLPVTVRTGIDPALEPEAIRNESGKIRLIRPFTDNSQDVAIRCIQQQRSDSYESESDNDLAHRPDRWSRDQNPDLWLVQSQIWASPNSNPKVNQQLNAIFQLINY